MLLSSFYNWSASIPSVVRDLGLSPMVQLWGYKNVDEFEQNVKQGYADWILGMNEYVPLVDHLTAYTD